MVTQGEAGGRIIDMDRLPSRFPTHRHHPTFWESLGRAIATFGFLEETLRRAIFAFTATREYPEAEVQAAYAEWLPKLERTLSDQLGNLIDVYGKAVRDHGGSKISDLDGLLADLRKAADMRNILCHGSWAVPDSNGASVPFFVNRRLEIVETAMDYGFIDQVQQHTAQLTCAVMNTVTAMGFRFPGSTGPGKPVWK